jgi:hypothetical protein
MTTVISVGTWDECEDKIRELEKANDNLGGVWFRGQSN